MHQAIKKVLRSQNMGVRIRHVHDYEIRENIHFHFWDT